MTLSRGYHATGPGDLVTVVTDFEMTVRPAWGGEWPMPPGASLALDRVVEPDLDDYRRLIRSVGSDWLWQARLRLADAELDAILRDHGVAVHVLRRDGEAVGIVELDARAAGSCEIAFFGVMRSAQGTGAARWAMARALDRAWEGEGVRRVWLHTCTLDHPAAPAFYRRLGFAAVRQYVEVLPDPRLDGLLPRDAAPHVPLAEGRDGP